MPGAGRGGGRSGCWPRRVDDPEPKVRRESAEALGVLAGRLRRASEGGERPSRRHAAPGPDPAPRRPRSRGPRGDREGPSRLTSTATGQPGRSCSRTRRSRPSCPRWSPRSAATSCRSGPGSSAKCRRCSTSCSATPRSSGPVCEELAVRADRGDVRRGAIAAQLLFHRRPRPDRLRFLVDRLADGPLEDRPTIAATIWSIDINAERLGGDLPARLAAALGDRIGEGGPRERMLVDHARSSLVQMLLRHPRELRENALPALSAAAHAELGRGAAPLACWVVLSVGADLPEADDLRARLVAALAEDRPDPWRQRIAEALRAHLIRTPKAIEPLRPGLVAAVAAESRGDREPIAAALLLALVPNPGPNATRLLAVPLLESLDRPMPDPRRERHPGPPLVARRGRRRRAPPPEAGRLPRPRLARRRRGRGDHARPPRGGRPMTPTERPATGPDAATTTTAPRRRLGVRGLMLLVAAAGLGLGLVLFWRAESRPGARLDQPPAPDPRRRRRPAGRPDRRRRVAPAGPRPAGAEGRPRARRGGRGPRPRPPIRGRHRPPCAG